MIRANTMSNSQATLTTPTCGSKERRDGKKICKLLGRQQGDGLWRDECIEPVQGLVVLM